MHTVTCTWSPPLGSRVAVREGGRVLLVAAQGFARALGPAALARLRLRGTLTLLLFDDEWRALTREEDGK